MTEGSSTHTSRPLAHPWRRFWLLAVVLAVCVVASRAHIGSVGADHVVRRFSVDKDVVEMVRSGSVGRDDIEASTPGVVEVRSVGTTELDGMEGVTLDLHALGEGRTYLGMRLSPEGDLWDVELCVASVEGGVIVVNGIDFSGYEAIYISTLIVICVALGLFASLAWQLAKRSWYSYAMVAAVGGAIYLAVQLVVFVFMGLQGFVDSFFELASTYGSLANIFVLLSVPAMGILMLALALSNISLMRHEGFSPLNMLGIALAVVWVVVTYFWFTSWQYTTGSYEEVRVQVMLQGIVSSAISYGEALFLATVVCAWRSTRHRCAYDQEYLVILGCGLRADGSPLPLLEGRIDRALAFEREQYEATGRHATFVPSGGQGPDEIWSEAEAMRRYLVAAGVDEGRIICEDRSTNTRENMAFSRARIDEARQAAGLPTEADDGFAPYRVAFATTNYHVFRGYTYAHAAGLAAEGLGAKTRLYFWPNAFLREFAGLLVAERWSIIMLYVVIAFVHGVAAYALFI